MCYETLAQDWGQSFAKVTVGEMGVIGQDNAFTTNALTLSTTLDVLTTWLDFAAVCVL